MPSKYEPLEIFLQEISASKNEVALSFKEIENIIGASLPASARKYREWWANQLDTTNRSQAKAWLSAGFIVDSVQQQARGGSVIFIRK